MLCFRIHEFWSKLTKWDVFLWGAQQAWAFPACISGAYPMSLPWAAVMLG